VFIKRYIASLYMIFTLACQYEITFTLFRNVTPLVLDTKLILPKP